MTNDEILSLVDSIMHKYASSYRSEAKSMAEEELKKFDEKHGKKKSFLKRSFLYGGAE